MQNIMPQSIWQIHEFEGHGYFSNGRSHIHKYRCKDCNLILHRWYHYEPAYSYQQHETIEDDLVVKYPRTLEIFKCMGDRNRRSCSFVADYEKIKNPLGSENIKKPALELSRSLSWTS